MSDIGEVYEALREESAAKRASNRQSSTALLRARGIPHTVKNGGAHVIVGEPAFADFWPGTGLWIERSTGRKGRGVFRLLKALGGRA